MKYYSKGYKSLAHGYPFSEPAKLHYGLGGVIIHRGRDYMEVEVEDDS